MENTVDVIRDALLVVALCLCVVCSFFIGTITAQVIMAIACTCVIAAILLAMGLDECFESYEDEA